MVATKVSCKAWIQGAMSMLKWARRCMFYAKVAKRRVRGDGVYATDAARIMATARAMVKNLYTRLYIYAKLEAFMYKYTAIMAVFRGVVSGNFHQTRTIFGAFGSVSGHRERRKSNILLQNRGIFRLFSRYFRLFRGRFSGSPRWSFFRSRWSLRF